jgi:alpha-D-xyloside xylohydrolase
MSFVKGMSDRKIPLSVFHFDCFWMKENEWCGFEWDKAMFPDVEGLLARMHARGLKVCAWINPYLGQKSPLFDEAADRGYLLMKPDGDVWQWDLWQAGCSIVDFTNPEAREWYQDKLRGLMRQGVDAFKTDFGERIPTDVVWYDGSDPEWMHNYYTYLYNKTVFEVMEEERGASETVLFARSATVGGQKFPVHWGGDCNSTYVSMAETLRGGLSLGLCGFGFWSHDISGFEGTASPDLYKRWLAFGLLSSHSRLHGSSSYRVPWLFGEEAVEVCRRFAELKNRLMPYLYSVAAESCRVGLPVLRAMMLEFDGLTEEDLDRQYMLGDALLVAPVMRADGNSDWYLPEGVWTHLLTGERLEGGKWYRKTFDFFSLPLYVRWNTVLPWGGHADRPDYDYGKDLRLDFYCFDDGARAEREIVGTDGKLLRKAEAERKGDVLEVRLTGDADPEIRLIGMDGVRAEIIRE